MVNPDNSWGVWDSPTDLDSHKDVIKLYILMRSEASALLVRLIINLVKRAEKLISRRQTRQDSQQAKCL
jgi:hypothetical protein